MQKKRRSFTVATLKSIFGGKVTVLGSATGLHLAASFADARFTPQFVNQLEEAGVKIYPVEEHAINQGNYENTIVLGYGCLDLKKVETGLRTLKEHMNT